MSMAATIAKRSLCSRDQVGAVIASTTNRVVAVGYNNPTAGFDHQGMDCLAWCPRARDDSNQPCVSLHAEANALVVCDRTQRELGTIYTTSIPCFNCAKLIANSGLARVVYLETGRGLERLEREKINPLTYLKDQGIGVTRYGPRTR